jgi:hypothetical protein
MTQPARKPPHDPQEALRCSVCRLWWWQGDDCENKADCNFVREAVADDTKPAQQA